MRLFSKKSNLLEWQKLIMPGVNKLVMNESQLRQQSYGQIQQHIKIADDCVNLINTTINPSVFFERYELLIEKLTILSKFEKYIKFDGIAPSVSLSNVIRQKDAAVKDLIDRSWRKTSEKAASMKTEKGKDSQYDKFLKSFDTYQKSISQDNIKFYRDLYINK